ncbi:MAG TPA: FAD-dependent oxidoreductase, partial [Halomonas sp.]|nr:FAD-dependent oxidoreductase [Halomonas sp.]
MPATQTQKTSSHAALVIIGTGMAGVGLARALRRLGDQRSITLVSADSGDDYSKPLLSTGFAKGLAPDQLAQRSAAELGEELNARIVIHTQVNALDVGNKSILLENGQTHDYEKLSYESLSYDALVLATGAEPQVPFKIASSVASSCFAINNLDNYRHFHAALGQNPVRVAIIGAGLVGCEFANDLLAGGHHVSVIAPEGSLLPRLLPAPLGNALGDAFSKAGIQLHLGRKIESIAPSYSNDIVLHLDDSDELRADIVLMATGLAPRIALAEAAGLTVSPNG